MSQDIVPAPAAAPLAKDSFILRWWRGDSRTERYTRNIVAALVWLYVLGQLFVFDADAWLLRRLPDWLQWLVIYKLVVLLFLAALILNFVSRRRFWSWALYIALCPLIYFIIALVIIAIVMGWIIFQLQSWTLLFAVLNVVLSFVRNFKFNFLIYVMALISTLVAVTSNSAGNLLSASFLLTGVIATLVLKRLIAIFRPTPIFNTYVSTMAWIMDYSRRKIIKPSSAKGVEPGQFTLIEFEKQYGDLSTAVMLSEVCSFLENKFRSYRKSGVAIAVNLLSLLGLLLIVVALLGIANYALYRANPAAFAISADHNLISFVYYSFCAVAGQRITEIYPTSVGARALSIFATGLYWVFLGGIALSLLFSVKKNQDDAAVEHAIGRLEIERQRMNQFVEEGFSLNLNEAIYILENLKGGLNKFIAMLRKMQ